MLPFARRPCRQPRLPLALVVAAGAATAIPSGGGGCSLPLPADPKSDHDAPADRQFIDRAAELGLVTPAWSRDSWGDPDDPFSQPCGRGLYSSGGVVAADLSGDGRVDVFVPRLDGPDMLFVQRADGTFVDEAAARRVDSTSPSGGALAVDLTGDGRLDLFVTSAGRADHRLFVARPDGAFDEQARARGVAGARPRPDVCGLAFGAAAGDVDGDGDLDLAVAAWLDSPRSAVFVNDGTGDFADRTETLGLTATSSLAGFSPVLVDLDEDRRTDLLFVADFEDTRLFWNEGDRFIDGTEAAGLADVRDGMGVDVGDIDGDGDLDVFITAICERIGVDCRGPFGFNGNHLLVQQGPRTFTDEAAPRAVLDGGWGWGTALWDADEDGHLDLGMTNGYAFLDAYLTDAGRLWRNDGRGHFIDVPGALGAEEAGQGRGYVPVDLDADGDLDLLVTDHDHGLRVFIRPGRPAASWSTVRLHDPTGTNRHGVGATVWARPAAATGSSTRAWQRRDLLAFDRYQGHGPLAAHFFVGASDAVDLRVRWPDGAEQVYETMPAGRVLTLRRTLD